MARNFILADDDQIPHTIRKLTRLRRRGFAFTIDLLGEAVVSEAEADVYTSRY